MEFEDYQQDNLEMLVKKFMDKDTYNKFEVFCWESYQELKRQEDELKWESQKDE